MLMSEVVSTAAGMVAAVAMPELPFSRALLVTDVELRPACGLCVRQQRSKKTVVEWTWLKWNRLSCCFGGQEAALPAVSHIILFVFEFPTGLRCWETSFVVCFLSFPVRVFSFPPG